MARLLLPTARGRPFGDLFSLGGREFFGPRFPTLYAALPGELMGGARSGFLRRNILNLSRENIPYQLAALDGIGWSFEALGHLMAFG